VIEFLLIFALGFLAAAILAMLVTPAIYGRIVKLTEKRIEATVPLSHAEIKGKADQMRAGFASQTAKLNAQLERERELRTQSSVRADRLQSDLAHVVGEKKLAEQQIDNLMVQAGDLRSEDRKKQQLVEKLSDTVRQYIKTQDNMELARLHNDLLTISTEVESMRIDLAANSAEAESLRAQVDSLNMQRDQLLNDIETLADTAQKMEKTLHAEQESHNQDRIELATTQSALSDREMMLEQAFEQIEQQKVQLEEQLVTHQNEGPGRQPETGTG
jgi:chromosome segregation ATPase